MEITPRCFSSSVRVASLFSTPRGLNEPVRWKSSALNRTSAPTRFDSVAEGNSGVRCNRPPMRSRARWTSSSESSESVVATVTSYGGEEPRDHQGCISGSVLALAAARQNNREDGGQEQDGFVSHVKGYGAIRWAVCSALALGCAAVGASAAPAPVARIPTGAGPCGAAAGFGSVWVAVYGSGRLVRIDPRRNRVIRRILVAPGICPIAVGARSIWVASDKTNILYRVDPRRGRVTARIRVAEWPAHVEVAYGSVWISAYQHGTVARVEPRTNRVSRVYDVGGNPSGLTQAAGSLWIAFGRNGTWLGRLDPATGAVRRVPIGHSGPGFLSTAAGS